MSNSAITPAVNFAQRAGDFFTPEQHTTWRNFPFKFYGKTMRNPVTGALSTGAGLGLLGAGAGYLSGLTARDPRARPGRRARNFGIVAALLGAGLGGFAGHHIRKSGSFQNTRSVEQAIFSDTSLSSREKSQLANVVRGLSISDYMDLHKLVASVSGAGAGALIAKFLFNRGIGGMVVAAIAGALAGAAGASFMGGRNIGNNPRGVRVMDETDYFGRSRMF